MLTNGEKEELASALSDFITGNGSFGFMRITRITNLAKKAKTDPTCIPMIIERLAQLLPTTEKFIIIDALHKITK